MKSFITYAYNINNNYNWYCQLLVTCGVGTVYSTILSSSYIVWEVICSYSKGICQESHQHKSQSKKQKIETTVVNIGD